MFWSRRPVKDEDDELSEGEYEDILDFVPFRDNPDASVHAQDAGATQALHPTADPEKKLARRCSSIFCPSWYTVLLILLAFVGTALVALNIFQLSRHLPDAIIFEQKGGDVHPALVLVTPPQHVATEPEGGPPPKRPAPILDGALDFPGQYPSLAWNATWKCRNAWYALKPLPCLAVIFSKQWDDGFVDYDTGDGLDYFVPKVCETDCTSALVEAGRSMSEACGDGDVFEMRGYEGYLGENDWIMTANPAAEFRVLLERHARTCRTSPVGDAELGFCMIDLYSRWGIVDGIRARAPEGYKSFMNATAAKRVEPAGMHKGREYAWEHAVEYWREERVFGPGPGETKCSWCTLTWLEGHLARGEEVSHIAGGVAQFLRRWAKPGRRCAGDRFDKIYKAAVDGYIARGFLHDNWENEPAADAMALFEHGPSEGFDPFLRTTPIMEDLQRKLYHSNERSEAEIGILNEEVSCIQVLRLAAQKLECYPLLNAAEFSEEVLSYPSTTRLACSSKCWDSIDIFQKTLVEACPSKIISGECDGCPETQGFSIAPGYHYSLKTIIGPTSSVLANDLSCRNADGERVVGSIDELPCGYVFRKMGVPSWVVENPTAKELIRTTRRLLGAISAADQDSTAPIMLTGDVNSRTSVLGDGICSKCLWRKYAKRVDQASLPEFTQFSPVDITGADDEVAREWVKTLILLNNACGFSESSLAVSQEFLTATERWKW